MEQSILFFLYFISDYVFYEILNIHILKDTYTKNDQKIRISINNLKSLLEMTKFHSIYRCLDTLSRGDCFHAILYGNSGFIDLNHFIFLYFAFFIKVIFLFLFRFLVKIHSMLQSKY